MKAIKRVVEPCQCEHEKSRHFVGWNVHKPAACMVPLCECRRYVAADIKKADK